MAKTRLFVIRHGRTMFNTIGRAQGWSDTPLTAEGERGIQALGIGLRESGLEFTRAYSSDSGRAIQTMGIILDELGLKDHRFLTALTNGSASGVLVALMGPTVGSSFMVSCRACWM